MSTDRDVTRIVRSWLEEGATALPDRVLDGVLDQLPATPQRRAWWPAWRLRGMNTSFRLAAAVAGVAIVAVIAVVAVNMLPRNGGFGAPGPITSPSPTPTPTAISTRIPTPTASPATSVAPYVEPTTLGSGTYRIPPDAANPGFTFTVPAGWESRYYILWKDRGGPGETAFGGWIVTNVFRDPCRWASSLLAPAVGPTVEDLATALTRQAGRNASAPADVTFGGYPAKRIEMSVAADLDVTSCDQSVFRPWLAVGESTGAEGLDVVRSVQLRGRIDVLYIVDVSGYRWVLDAWHLPATSAANLAELEAAVASIVIHPPVSSASPSP